MNPEELTHITEVVISPGVSIAIVGPDLGTLAAAIKFIYGPAVKMDPTMVQEVVITRKKSNDSLPRFVSRRKRHVT